MYDCDLTQPQSPFFSIFMFYYGYTWLKIYTGHFDLNTTGQGYVLRIWQI